MTQPGTTDQPTCLSTFSGLGGMDLGLEAAGFRHVGCVEWDEWARLSLKANRGGVWPLLEPGDIEVVAETLEPTHVGLRRKELDLLVGAPPCQPYSKAAQWSPSGRGGLSDRRGQYLDDLLTIAETFLPKAILLENVRGFVQGKTSALDHIQWKLDRIEQRHGERYLLEHRIIDAADVGAPQHRSRAIVVASRIGSIFPWPAERPPTTAWDAIGSLEQDADELPLMTGKWADLLPSIPEGENYLWHTDRGEGQPLFGWRTRYWSFLLKLAKDRPSWTLPAQPGPSTGPFHWDNRPLSVPELLRLQTFPADWIVEGPAHRDRVRQIGNATPPLLAEALGRSVLEHLGHETGGNPRRWSIERASSTPSPRRPAPIATKYHHLVGHHDAHPGHGRGPGAASVS